VDKGYHNFYFAARFTGQFDANGERVFETRKVKKTWFDNKAGRLTIRRKTGRMTRKAQVKGLMTEITNNTLNSDQMQLLSQM